MNRLINCRVQDVCPRDVEADARIAAEGIDPESDEADEIRRQVGEHGDWHDSQTPCGE